MKNALIASLLLIAPLTSHGEMVVNCVAETNKFNLDDQLKDFATKETGGVLVADQQEGEERMQKVLDHGIESLVESNDKLIAITPSRIVAKKTDKNNELTVCALIEGAKTASPVKH
jgi:hypothetical protein